MSDLEKLKALESRQNDGRGVSCVRSIIFYLERGDHESANSTAINENDKLRNYPEIRSLLFQMLPAYGAYQKRLDNLFT